MNVDPPVSPPPYDELSEQPGDGPATRAQIEARKRRLAAQADIPPDRESSGYKREYPDPDRKSVV